MGFLSEIGLEHLWGKVKDRLALKMDKATYDPQGKGVDVFGYADGKAGECLPLTGGKMTGALIAAADSNPAAAKVRNTSLNGAETTPTTNGDVAWTYE